MLKKLVIGLFVVSVLWVAFSLPQPQPRPTVVKIQVEYGHGSRRQGGGVFVADDLILTAGHIVSNAEDVWVVWSDGKRHKAINWYKESEADLGVVYIKTPKKEPTAEFDNAVVGEEVWALGNPFGVFPILTKGIVSAINMPDSYSHQKNMIITDCAVNPGNSGCPLFDEDGNILGICSYKRPYAQGMNYFIRAEICELTLAKYYAIEALNDAE